MYETKQFVDAFEDFKFNKVLRVNDLVKTYKPICVRFHCGVDRAERMTDSRDTKSTFITLSMLFYIFDKMTSTYLTGSNRKR